MAEYLEAEKIEVFHEDIILRLENAVKVLTELAERSAERGNMKNADRLTSKAAAVSKVLDEQTERLLNVTTVAGGREVAALVYAVGNADGMNEAGTALAAAYIMDMLR